MASEFNVMAYQQSLQSLGIHLIEKQSKKSQNKLSKQSINDRRDRGVFYNVSYVPKGKKGGVKTLKMAKNEVPPSLFTPSRTSTILDVVDKNGTRRPTQEVIQTIMFFDVEYMVCGKYTEIGQYLQLNGIQLNANALVSYLDFAPVIEQGNLVFNVSNNNSRAVTEFLSISRNYTTKKDEKNATFTREISERMADSVDHHNLILDLWNNRAELKIDVSEERRIEIYTGIKAKFSSLTDITNNTHFYPALDISKYEGFGRSTVGSVKESKFTSDDFVIDILSGGKMGDSTVSHYKIFILLNNMDFLEGKTILVSAKKVENLRYFLTDMINGNELVARKNRTTQKFNNEEIARQIISGSTPFFAIVVPRIKGEKREKKGTGVIRLGGSSGSKLTALPETTSYVFVDGNNSESSGDFKGMFSSDVSPLTPSKASSNANSKLLLSPAAPGQPGTSPAAPGQSGTFEQSGTFGQTVTPAAPEQTVIPPAAPEQPVTFEHF